MRLEVRPGQIAVRNGRLVQVQAVQGSGPVRVRDVVTGEESDVLLAELRARAPAAGLLELDGRFEKIRALGEASFRRAEERERLLRAVLEGTGSLGERLEAAAASQRLSIRTLYRWLARYRDAAQTSSLLPVLRGVAAGTRRLDPARETLANEIIEREYLSRARPKLGEIVRMVRQRCTERGLKPISRKALQARINRLDPRRRTRARQGARAAQREHGHTPGHFAVSHPLESVQIDHTLADIMVVDERDREAIGRPWLTLAIDVLCRAVLGFYVSLEPPSATSIALCLTQACLPKEPWLAARGLSDIEWPVSGLPVVLRADNGRDFRGEALRRGCSEYGVELDFRPIARPHYGGHIERLIGSVMGRVHLLPGTTFSNPRERQGYPSEKNAAMTLAEFEHWLVVEIAERYHRTFHRGLGATPLGVWEEAMAHRARRVLPGDPQRFRIAFLPLEYRKLQRNGVHLNTIRYWSDALPHCRRSRARMSGCSCATTPAI